MISQLRTDIGLARKKNEDAAFIGDGLYILCDGMGGHQAGDVAANMAVDTLSAELLRQEPAAGALLAAVSKANTRIFGRGQADRTLRGMGTTLTALWAAGDHVLIAQVGDSRAYLFREGALRQCTHDHSMVAELVRMGTITPEEARRHVSRNIITRSLGTEPGVNADIFEIGRRPGDRWLLCSDGLSDPLMDEEIAAVLAGHTVYDAADRLVTLALASGGPDNITLLLMDDVGGEQA